MPKQIDRDYADLHAGQSVIHLKELILQRFRGLDREARLRDKALTVAHSDMSRRLEGMNKFREELERNTALYVTREEWSSNHSALESSVDKMNLSIEQRLRALERLVYIGVGAAIIINGVAMYFFKK